MAIKIHEIAFIHEHYHVTDAGIRLVLESLCNGIARYFGKATQYLWYSPKKFQGQATPFEQFSDQFVTLIEDEELGYLTKSFDCVAQFETAIDNRKQTKLRLIKQKLKDYDAVVHIVQNPTLLKNPVETQANARIATKMIDQNYVQIWHIHDLLEDSISRQALRNDIKKIAGEKTEEKYGRNGCGIAWITSPNIFYALINMKDRSAIQGFLPKELAANLFYFPDPVDIDKIRVRPSFERDGITIDDQIKSYCQSNGEKGYTYDPQADIILATEFARERKNTGEQILLLNMLNAMPGTKKRKFQLIVTLVPTMGKDAERIKIFQEYIRLNNLPVVMGFGNQIIARDNDLEKGQFTITDLWSHPKACAVISTSVKEGFGLNFINPAIATVDNDYTLPTVGRRIKDIFPDFEAAGMVMPQNPFYDSIVIDPSIIVKDSVIFDEKKNRIIKSRLPHRYQTISYEGDIVLGKDFSNYSADEQILLMDIIDYNGLSVRLSRFIASILDKDTLNRITKRNAKAIMENFSLRSYIASLKEMIEKAWVYKRERLSKGEKPTMILDNAHLIDFYGKIEGEKQVYR